MSSQTTPAKNTMPTFEPSPWTEVFQRAQEAAEAKSAEAANQAKTAPQPTADRAEEPTQDALSTIFNGR